MGALVDISGMTFGRLLALRRGGPESRGEARWLCECECGELAFVRSSLLRSGKTRSCGCLRKEVSGQRAASENRTHGQSHAAGTYASWQAMKTRCLNPNSANFRYYGGRGIGVCIEWAESFEAFLRDMGERPVGYTLDRVDVNGNYEPSNCRWATPKEQAANRRPRSWSGL